jgi:GNAT superfamily N-acetyltransferase
MTSISVRDARADDAVPMADLCAQLGYPSSPERVRERFARLAGDDNVRTLVATDADAVIGLATVHVRFTINHDTPIGQLTMLVVDERNRTHGVGRALVETAERWARERGCKRFVVTTALRRADAHAFYERLEYKHTGRRYGKDFS